MDLPRGKCDSREPAENTIDLQTEITNLVLEALVQRYGDGAVESIGRSGVESFVVNHGGQAVTVTIDHSAAEETER